MREGDPSQSTVLATDFSQSAMLLINPLSLHSSGRLPFSFISVGPIPKKLEVPVIEWETFLSTPLSNALSSSAGTSPSLEAPYPTHSSIVTIEG